MGLSPQPAEVVAQTREPTLETVRHPGGELA
jgi:hypothetical protein